MDKLDTQSDKDFFDCNQELRRIWASDSTRNWQVYSKEIFRDYWTVQKRGYG